MGRCPTPRKGQCPLTPFTGRYFYAFLFRPRELPLLRRRLSSGAKRRSPVGVRIARPGKVTNCAEWRKGFAQHLSTERFPAQALIYPPKTTSLAKGVRGLYPRRGAGLAPHRSFPPHYSRRGAGLAPHRSSPPHYSRRGAELAPHRYPASSPAHRICE